MPEHVVKLIPSAVLKLLKSSPESPLVVVRNLHLLDVCAGRARICKWGLEAKLNAVALDRAYGMHLDINSDEGLAAAALAIPSNRTSCQ